MNSRRVILEILTKFAECPKELEEIINSEFSASMLDHRDRRFVFEIVYGVIRMKLNLDYLISNYLENKKLLSNDDLVQMLRIGIYQIVYLDRVPDHAAVNETVLLAKQYPKTKHLTGVVNAVLRNIIKNRKKLPAPDNEQKLSFRLSIKYSHPEWLIERWLRIFGFDKTKRICIFNNTKPEIYLRRKLNGITKQQFEIDAKSICDGPRGYLKLYYRLKKAVLPENVRLFKEGNCTVQAPSSGWIIALCDINKGEKILDLCSAPGGKTTFLSELVGTYGAVCSCDISFGRIKKVVETKNRMMIGNIYLVQCDGRRMPFKGCFNKILLDVPCSGTGVLHRHPDARWLKTPHDFEWITEIQKTLLDSAAESIVKGGIIVYATCSLEPEENDLQIKKFLERHNNFIAEKASGVIPETFVNSRGFLQINPFEHKMDGMFAARLRRVA